MIHFRTMQTLLRQFFVALSDTFHFHLSTDLKKKNLHVYIIFV